MKTCHQPRFSNSVRFALDNHYMRILKFDQDIVAISPISSTFLEIDQIQSHYTIDEIVYCIKFAIIAQLYVTGTLPHRMLSFLSVSL